MNNEQSAVMSQLSARQQPFMTSMLQRKCISTVIIVDKLSTLCQDNGNTEVIQCRSSSQENPINILKRCDFTSSIKPHKLRRRTLVFNYGEQRFKFIVK